MRESPQERWAGGLRPIEKGEQESGREALVCTLTRLGVGVVMTIAIDGERPGCSGGAGSVSDWNRELVALRERIEALESRTPQTESLTLLVFSGELDKLLAAFVIATGAAACGMQVSMFFTFWAAAALKKRGPQARGKNLVEKVFGWMLPGGFSRQKLSKLDFCGLGRRMMRREMVKKNVADLPQLIGAAKDLGVEIHICEMSMSLMGIRREELMDYPGMRFCGAARFLERAASSNVSLFI